MSVMPENGSTGSVFDGVFQTISDGVSGAFDTVTGVYAKWIDYRLAMDEIKRMNNNAQEYQRIAPTDTTVQPRDIERAGFDIKYMAVWAGLAALTAFLLARK